MVLPLIFAFQIGSSVTGACHESITLAGSTRAGFPDPSAAPRPTENQARALEDLPFDLPGGRDDVWSMTLVIGVRSNDISDNAPTDLAELVSIHDDPEDQPAHCLRKPEDDGNAGDVAAIANCRAFIIDELTQGGLLADTIDTNATEQVATFLAFRGRVTIELPTFAYHLGRALHALEDGYAHAMRDPQTGHVRSVLNWIDYIRSDHYDPAVDGYMHLSKIDDCERDEEYEVLRVQHATDAVTALIAAVADDTGGAPGRAARVVTVLDTAFTLDPGCSPANRWCNATEPGEQSSGCNAGGSAGTGLVFAVLGLTRRRKNAKRSKKPNSSRFRGFALVLLCAPTAYADPYADARFGGALDRTALAISAGGGDQLGDWKFGGEAEWNPWFSFDAGRAKAGALNVYATAAYTWWDGHCFTLYTRAELGTSTILFELLGVDKYQTGLYFGWSLLGVSLKHGEHWRFTLDPSQTSWPMPQVTGVPFYYRQYRISVGAEYRF